MNDTLMDKIRQAAAQSVKESGKAEKPLPKGTPGPGEPFHRRFSSW